MLHWLQYLWSTLSQKHNPYDFSHAQITICHDTLIISVNAVPLISVDWNQWYGVTDSTNEQYTDKKWSIDWSQICIPEGAHQVDERASTDHVFAWDFLISPRNCYFESFKIRLVVVILHVGWEGIPNGESHPIQ